MPLGGLNYIHSLSIWNASKSLHQHASKSRSRWCVCVCVGDFQFIELSIIFSMSLLPIDGLNVACVGETCWKENAKRTGIVRPQPIETCYMYVSNYKLNARSLYRSREAKQRKQLKHIRVVVYHHKANYKYFVYRRHTQIVIRRMRLVSATDFYL